MACPLKRRRMNRFWWIEVGVPEDERNSACVRQSLVNRSYGEIKKGVWRLYRRRTDRLDLTSSDKMLLWAMSERFRVESMSCTDAVGYLSKMVGVSRKTAGKSIQRLVDAEIIWIVEEGEDRRARRRLEARKYFRKHFILVGLSYELGEG